MRIMKKRKAGVLLNISSLPGPFGIGVLGKEAESFIDKTAAMGFTYWQILPIGTLDSGNSPYAGESAFAGNYLYIDPRKLAAKGLVNDADVREGVYYGSPYTVDYEFAFAAREKLLRKAYLNYKTISGETKDLSADSAVEAVKLKKEITEFTEKNKWVVKYARFKAIKNKNGGMPWRKWNNSGKSETDKDILNGISEETEYVIFVQYLFYKQWREIKDYANGKNIRIIGDMPLYVSMDSCDVWSEPWLFQLDKDTMEPKQVAGVPPDYFSEDGQLWGNPLYDWNAMKKKITDGGATE